MTEPARAAYLDDEHRSDVRITTTTAIDEHRCPVDDCGTKLRGRRIFCGPCWRQVPGELKAAIRHRAQAPGPATKVWERWLDTVAAAVHAVEVTE